MIAASLLLVFAEPPGQQPLDSVETSRGVVPQGCHGDAGPLGGAEGEEGHDRASADGLAAAGDGHVGIEALDRLHEFRGSAGVEALAVDDRKLADERAFRNGRGRAVLGVAAVEHRLRGQLPASTREATLMYLRPASWALSTAA